MKQEHINKIRKIASALDGTKIGQFKTSCKWWSGQTIVLSIIDFEIKNFRLEGIVKALIYFTLDLDNGAIENMNVHDIKEEENVLNAVRKMQNKLATILESE